MSPIKKYGHHKVAFVLMIVVTILWGGGYSAAQLAIDDGWSVYSILFFRNSIGFLICLLFCIKTKFWKDKYSLKVGFGAGVIFFVAYAFQLEGQKLTSIPNTAFITTCGLVFVPIILRIVFKNKLRWTVVLAFVLEIIAALVLSFTHEVAFHIGDALVLVGAFLFAVHIIFIDKKAKDLNPIVITCVQLFTMGVLAGISIIIRSDPLTGGPKGWPGILFCALFAPAFCSAGQYWAQKHLSPNETSIIMSQEGLFATIISIILYGEVITVNLVVGAVLVTIAIFLIQVQVKNGKKIPVKNLETPVKNDIIDDT
jgi:drug/metabolite transporter (DMT)-like permease